MLSKDDKKNLRNLQTYHCSYKEVNGKPVATDGTPFVIPDCDELLDKAIADIKLLGFKDVTRTSPYKANCIVRIFSTKHHKYDDELIYNIFGTIFYVRENCVWTAGFGSETFPIRYDKFETSRWLCQDEQIIFKHHFVDFYLSIS